MKAFLIPGSNYVSKIYIVTIERQTQNYFIINNIKYRKGNKGYFDDNIIGYKKSSSRFFSDDMLYAIHDKKIIDMHINQCLEDYYEEMKENIIEFMKHSTFYELYKLVECLKKIKGEKNERKTI